MGVGCQAISTQHADVVCDGSELDVIFDINISKHFLILSSKFMGAGSDVLLTLVSKIKLTFMSNALGHTCQFLMSRNSRP